MDSASFWVIGLLGAAFIGVSLFPARFRLPLWILLILVIVLPWLNYQDHTHWMRVGWVPFVPPPDLTVSDLAGNLILYAPFGLFYARLRGRDRLVLIEVLCLAAALSTATEATQLYSHGRFPSATDVVMNVTGAVLGAWFATRTPRRHS